MTDNTPSTARDLGNLSTSRQFNDFVGPSDPNDYYRFNLESNSSFDLKIDGGNYNLGLYRDANNNGQIDAGERIVSLENGSLTSSGLRTSLSTSNSSINGVHTYQKTLNLGGNLGEGNYYLQVYSSGSNASYQLNLGAEATQGSGGTTGGTNNIHGTAGDDLLNGTAGDDTIFGYGGKDTINGNDGNDSISTSSGFNSISGGSGSDTITVSGGGFNSISGGSGSDTITVSGGGFNSISGGSGSDTITVSGGGFNSISGGSGSDTIAVSGGGNNSISGGSGNDTITVSGGGNNYISGGIGNDVSIYNGNYNDYSITIDGTRVTVTGSLGTDTLEDIETLQFLDRTVDLVQNTNKNLSTNSFNVVESSLNPGDNLNVELSLQNTEAGEASAFDVEFYLSKDSTIGNNDDLLLDTRSIEGLTGNTTTELLTQNLTLPDANHSFWTGDGTYHIGMVIDSGDVISETNENDNTDSEAIEITTPITVGEIQGLKWNDLDGDGVRDSGEPGLADWTIYLDENQNGQRDAGELSTLTDASGNYTFTDLAPGTYYVAEEMQSGWEQTYPEPPSIFPAPIENSNTTIDARQLRENVDPGPEVVFYDFLDNGTLTGGITELETDNSTQNNGIHSPLQPTPWNVSTLLDNGPTDNRIDIVFLGDGYTNSELGTYQDDVNNLLSPFFAELPLDDYSKFFNVHRVDVISNESGVDNDPNGVLKDTALDMGFGGGGVDRGLILDLDKAKLAANNAPDVDQILAIGNSTKHGGVAWPSEDVGTASARTTFASEILLHEFGHSFANLADEYDYGGPVNYTGPEPEVANVSIYNANEMEASQTKWYRWLDEPNVGTFEGANYSEQGIYRPTENSKMRSLGQPFEQVNIEQFILTAYQVVQPIDNATPSGFYGVDDTFFVDPVDPVSHDLDVQWFLDEVPISGATSTTFDRASTLNLTPGTYTLKAEVVDNTDLVRDEEMRAQWMTEERSWTLRVEGEEPPVARSHEVILNPGEVITDINFGNRLIEETPDEVNLVSNSFNIVENSLHPNENFQVEFSIQNTEAGEASAFDVEFYLSKDSTIGNNDDILLDTRSIDGLTGNTTTELLTQNLTLPDANHSFWTGDGTYHIGAVIDSGDVISETNENDNTDAEAIEITTPVTLGEIRGLKWNDLDGDGVRDTGEPGLADWTIYLDENQNGQRDAGELSTITDASGNYAFTDLAPGTYYVAEEMQRGWKQTSPGNIGLPTPRLQNKGFSSTELAIARASNLETYESNKLSSVTEWVVSLEPNQSPDDLARSLGATNLGATGFIPNTYRFEFPEHSHGLQIQDELNSLSNITFFFPLVEQQLKKQFIPNDPLFSDQWHLVNTGQMGGTVGADTNIETAWDLAQGTGVVIGIVDDGLQYAHPDLNSRYRQDLSYDFNDNDADPSPVFSSEVHGTAVAGVAAASGNNGIGVSGSAPEASLAGLRLNAGPSNDWMNANALSYMNQDIDIYNNSWKPGASFLSPGPLTLAAMEDGVINGRDGLGSIYLFAGGNDRQDGLNVNYNGLANSRYTIAVAAIDHNGKQAIYSESGAPLLISGYSSAGLPDTPGIATTDLLGSYGYFSGDYTDNSANGFGGTSSATPLVAGVIAQLLDINPNLSWRDVQHILVETAEHNDPSDLDWTTNGAGHLVNHKYGFGAIDATAAVKAATDWVTVGQEISTTSGRLDVNQDIPDNNPTGISSTFTINDDIDIEWVEIVFDATHSARGDLEIVLISPDGTESVLAESHKDSQDNYSNWVLTSARHWGESSLGEWTLKVSDEQSVDIGTWNSWQLNIYGTSNNVHIEGTHTVTLNSGEIVTGIDFGNHNEEPEEPVNPAAIETQDQSWTVATTADFNADNKDDVLWRNSSGDNELWLMDGSSVSSTVNLSNSTLELVGANDFDGDNDADLMWRNTSTGANELWTMDGGSVTSTDAIRSAATNWEVQGTEDFNGDGNADIFWRDPITGQNAIWFMDGSSRVNSGNFRSVGTNWEVAALDDFNADGKTDILWNDSSNGANAIWLMDGLSLVSGRRIRRTNAGWELQGTEDFNGDNKADLLWRNGSGSNAVWFIDDTTIASGQNLSGAIARWDVRGLGDFDNNGSPDILWRDSATGDNALWLMDGTTHSGGAMLV